MTPKTVLVAALKECGANMRRHVGKVGFQLKGKANLVTMVNRGNEKLALDRILKAFPDHGYYSEERPPKAGNGYTWVIDPLDGTTNFAHSFPVCCTSIGLVGPQGPVLGGVYDPWRDELFLAEKGKGATLNGKRIRVSRTARLMQSLLLTGFPYDRADKAAYYLSFYQAFVERCHDVRRSGSAALDLCWTACGRVDGFWELKLHPWDVAAGMLIVAEAGGEVSDFSGKPWPDLKGYGHQTLASNGRIHDEVLRVIRRKL